MDKILKFLMKLSEKEREIVLSIMNQVKNNDITGIDCKPLSGEKHLYRVRKWSIRIVFRKEHWKNTIVAVDYRWWVYKK